MEGEMNEQITSCGKGSSVCGIIQGWGTSRRQGPQLRGAKPSLGRRTAVVAAAWLCGNGKQLYVCLKSCSACRTGSAQLRVTEPHLEGHD
jgi:hypothetical protein